MSPPVLHKTQSNQLAKELDMEKKKYRNSAKSQCLPVSHRLSELTCAEVQSLLARYFL